LIAAIKEEEGWLIIRRNDANMIVVDLRGQSLGESCKKCSELGRFEYVFAEEERMNSCFAKKNFVHFFWTKIF
jgi:hypothetical protein